MTIYRKPQSETIEAHKSELRPLQGAFVVLATIFSSVLFIGLRGIIGQFMETFSSFGAELPMMTLFIVSIKDFIPALAIPVIIIGITTLIPSISSKVRKQLYLWCKLHPAIAIAITTISMIAMYLPIFSLGNVV